MIGQTFLGRYEVTRLLGEGGMGRVYLARQLDLNRQVVVKVMSETTAADPKFRMRFQRETQLMAKFQHPYVVTMYDAALDDPLGSCIVMEYIRGVNLDFLLAKNERFVAARVGRILGQLCEALQAAHELGIIHRDLKPSNIMVVDPDSPRERIKVMDFGLAKDINPETDLPRVTVSTEEFAVGTPGYICPEQVRGEQVDHRGDLYSVGVLAYELLAGRLPFTGPTAMDMVLAHATEPPPNFADIGLEGLISPHIEEVIMATLAKDPAERPQSAAELAERFDLALVRATQDAEAEADNSLNIQLDYQPDRPFQDAIDSPPDDPNALEFSLEAWMPQKIALLKLRGFVQSQGGEILESVPGKIRVRLPAPHVSSRTGPLSWMGLAKRANGVLLDLRMTGNPQKENLLQVTARFHPGSGYQVDDPRFRRQCVDQFIDLRGYLIGVTEEV